ncbi:hypothetical protein CONPUDRAFT_160716 [Coniophora puteana RWD-64-598 SS2]|uniref:FAD-binding PCMH-type domain-containing protein n=1 Tax=Coniophora puteana (strain RWD-64-598) TaxID=741705 RepID=R7SCA5_CONPW|nr:uncharacterized protein CONPUDRAFT_160716 [Coniophora puteana RWD-64-598 SS2]EIW73783.1 hypothetical protein CONPUDRAFT_160716 [Coniophora puteana RWD-64-598 SS2]
MKNISYDAVFVPDGAPSSETYDVFTLGAGVQWSEAYTAAEAREHLLLGGISYGGSVGAAGGWFQGGGHSALSPVYGLGVDNVVQMTVVTSAGDRLMVNAYQHADLFWALRGGGGSTYGITYAGFPSLADDGWDGYGGVSNSTLWFMYISPNVAWSEANQTWDPFFARASNAGLEVTTAQTTYHPSFLSFHDAFFSKSTGQNGFNVIIGSRLIPKETYEENYEEFANAMLRIPGMPWHLVAGGRVSKADPESTGLNPAWRDSAVFDTVKKQQVIIRSVTPGSGAYFNEASPFEEDFQYTFFGDHYPRLKAIKDQYDPHSLFIVRQGWL